MLQRFQELRLPDWLYQTFVDAHLLQGLRSAPLSSRDHDQFECVPDGRVGLDGTQEFRAVEDRHPEIGNDEVVRSPGIFSAADSVDHAIARRATSVAHPGGGGLFLKHAATPIDPRGTPHKEMIECPHLRVLVAEDNTVNQLVTRRLLERRGMEVIMVATGVEALERLEQFPVDLVLMDIQMPVMDGYEATARIRSREAACGLPRIPTLALTAHVTSGDREKCLRAGMDGYVSKPIRIDALISAIANFKPPKSPRPELAGDRAPP